MDVFSLRPATARAWALTALLVLGATAFIAVPAWELIVPGPFHWHIGRPRTWQGGIEAIALALLVAAGFTLRTRAAIAFLAVVPAALYLRRHAVDLPLVVDWVYVETLFALGALARRACGAAAREESWDRLRDFVLGVCLWSVAAWSLSAFGIGTVIDLRWLTLVLAIIAFAARPRLFAAHLWRRVHDSDRRTRAIAGVFVAGALVLYARSAVVTGYDSLWYGLRPEDVLVADGSVFNGLGLVSPVYYFPKLYELLLTPLAALGSTSVMIGVGIWVLLMIGLAGRRLLVEAGVSEGASWLGVALVVTMPAIANSAVSVKPDLLALLLILLALGEGIGYLKTRDPTRLFWFLAMAVLATQAKLTAIPYVGALGLALVAAMLATRATARTIVRSANGAERRLGALALALASATAAFVTARTWLLAGVPTIGPEPLIALWNALGLHLAAPAGTLQWTQPQIWGDVPAIVFDELFRPNRLPHIIVTWLGNAWLYLFLAAALFMFFARGAAPRFRTRVEWLGGSLMLAGLALMIGWRHMARGGDGNYFMAGAATAVLCGVVAACRRVPEGVVARAFATSLCALAMFQASYAFVSAGWSTGTRTFDLDLTRSVRPVPAEKRQILQRAGLARIAHELRQGARVRRAIGIIDGGTIGFRLPCRFEDLVMIGYSRPEYLADASALLAFMKANGIDALILPRGPLPPATPEDSKNIARMLPYFESLPGVRRIDDERYLMLDFAESPALSARAGEAINGD